MNVMKMNMRDWQWGIASVLCLSLIACNGGGKAGGGGTTPSSGAQLVSMSYGRVVDIYAYNRLDPVRNDRRDTLNRLPVLVAKDVVIRPEIESQTIFYAAGNINDNAHYRFLSFDANVGHEELLILWDNTIPPEAQFFEDALKEAKGEGFIPLPELPGAFREQNSTVRPIPVVPRNAALILNFNQDLGVDSGFFAANPDALQLLQFTTDPSNPSQPNGFRPLPARIVAQGKQVIVDTTLIGGETFGGFSVLGLPASEDSVTANLRLALPTTGLAARQLDLSEDPIAELNGLDAKGANAVIRDFRSGNLSDGAVGALVDVQRPMVVARAEMGITKVDAVERILTLNKRFAMFALRGRIPFVDGGLEANGLPGGQPPTIIPLRGGDVITQTVMSQGGEEVQLRAEILQNMDIESDVGDPDFGLDSNQTQGHQSPVVRIRVGSLTATDSQGNVVSFTANALPLGENCQVLVRYYEDVPFDPAFGTSTVTDRDFRSYFLSVDPVPPVLDENRIPVPIGTKLDPMAGIGLRFDEPMDLLSVDPLGNFLLSNETLDGDKEDGFGRKLLLELLAQPKPSSLSILQSQVQDQEGDGTLLRLSPALGHFHRLTDTETYWVHLLAGPDGVTDSAGNGVDLFDLRSPGNLVNFSVKYSLDPDAADNWVASRIFRFEGGDEDGSEQGSIDMFGQFQLFDGQLRALPVSRFNAVADDVRLQTLTRFDRGECVNQGAYIPFNAFVPPGIAYACPSMVVTQFAPPASFVPPFGPQVGGGILEPNNPRGSRLQMTYREDDFGLSYTSPNHLLLDLEQLHWAPFLQRPVVFDVFDRYSMRAAHSDWRPDVTYFAFDLGAGPECFVDCSSGRSGLRENFAANLLQGTSFTSLVEDVSYQISPNDTFKASTDRTFIPYPEFERTYTWRDSRLVKWDMNSNMAIGLGGAHQPFADPSAADTTASISSPWVPDLPPTGDIPLIAPNAGINKGSYVLDDADFLGFRARDHNPIALPLLLDFQVFPDSASNGFASGANQFHVALSGPCWTPMSPGGYYNQTTIPLCGTDWPALRVHRSGGRDPITGNDVFVDPGIVATAAPSFIKDIFLGDPTQGLFTSKPQDDHLLYAQADFVRRVSMVTFGFWDTLKPNQNDLEGAFPNWDGSDPDGTNGPVVRNGIPDLSSLGGVFGGNARIRDMIGIMDPPPGQQPLGTKVSVEYRGLQQFDPDPQARPNVDKIWQPSLDSTLVRSNIAQFRGNLLNPHYAEEAYRYAMTNQTQLNYNALGGVGSGAKSGPRVPVTGLTSYVNEDNLDLIRNPANGLLPRYMNFRIIMENNLLASPPLSPALRSFAVVYRVDAP